MSGKFVMLGLSLQLQSGDIAMDLELFVIDIQYKDLGLMEEDS